MKHEYEFDDRQVRDIKDGRAQKRTRRLVSKAIKSGLMAMQLHHKTKEVRRGGGSPVAHRWTTRTGEAARSFHIDWKPGALIGSYWSDLKRMKMLEEGGTITPKRAKFLAIPTEHARSGVGPAASPRHYPGLVFIQSLRGNPLLVRPRAGGNGFDVMFVLRRQVKLSPRQTLARTAKKKAPFIAKLVADAMEKGMSRA